MTRRSRTPAKSIYMGSFDVLTWGHYSVAEMAARLFGKTDVAVAFNPNKTYLYSRAERVALARQGLAGIDGVRVCSFEGLFTDYVKRHGYNVVVRGVRSSADLNDAMLLDALGEMQFVEGGGVIPVYLPCKRKFQDTSSTSTKAILDGQGRAYDLAPLVSIHAYQARKMSQYICGLTGVSGAGKTTIANEFKAIAASRGIDFSHIEMDKLGHRILNREENDKIFRDTRQEIIHRFGVERVTTDGNIDRKKLGALVFGDPQKMAILNRIMAEPMNLMIADQLRHKTGFSMLDGALFAETPELLPLIHNNVVLVSSSQKALRARLAMRDGLDSAQFERRQASQFTTKTKRDALMKQITKDRYGRIINFDNSSVLGPAQNDLMVAFNEMMEAVDIFGELRVTGFLKLLRVEQPKQAYDLLRSFYAGNDRHYHAWSHIVDGINQIQNIEDQLDDPQALLLGWLFHDAVYDVTNNSSEDRSMALLQQVGTAWGLDARLIKKAQRFIEVTKHGRVRPETSDELYMVDVDFSMFGRPWKVFSQCVNDIRYEYPALSNAEFNNGRRAFLQSLGPDVFRTDRFKCEFAEQARSNIDRSISALK